MDNAGNTEAAPPVTIKKETAPPVTSPTHSGTPGGGGNFTSCVDVTLQATTGGSGVALTEYSFDGVNWQPYTGQFTVCSDGATDISYRSMSNAGNEETPNKLTIKIDKTPPVITITGVSEGAQYPLCAPPAPAYEVVDATSGLASIEAATTVGNANGSGAFSYEVTATDVAGNTAVETVTYKVVYSFDGFQSPVTLNRPFKAGSTIPVKLRLSDGCGSLVTDAVATLSLQILSGAEPSGDPIDGVSNVPDSGNTFRYVPEDGQYIYNLSAGALSVGTWRATVSLDDTKTYAIDIGIK